MSTWLLRVNLPAQDCLGPLLMLCAEVSNLGPVLARDIDVGTADTYVLASGDLL